MKYRWKRGRANWPAANPAHLTAANTEGTNDNYLGYFSTTFHCLKKTRKIRENGLDPQTSGVCGLMIRTSGHSPPISRKSVQAPAITT
jgi:hypothetical protein